MIVPTDITNYSRTSMQLLEFAIFAVCVAGKNSDQTAKKVDALWRDKEFRTTLSVQWEHAPINDLQHDLYVKLIRKCLEAHKIGQYDRLSRVIFWLNQNSNRLDTVLFNEMVDFRGIGPKTAAFFLLHSRQKATVPVIDTHICKYMATKGVDMKVTSSLAKYLENAKIVADWIQRDFPGMTLAQADLTLWKKYSGRDDKQGILPLADPPQMNTGFGSITAQDLRLTFGDPNTREV